MTRPVAGGLLAVAALLAFSTRSIGLERVFPGDGTVIFALGDAFYHARRAFVSFEQFPRVMLFDPYLNYPQGAYVPWPPLYDLLLGGVARLFGSTQAVFERVAAWAPVFLGVLTLAPVYAAGRIVSSRAAGVGAALLFALLPASVFYSNVGNADHHAAQALIGASVLALSLRAVSEEPSARRSVRLTFAALALMRAALLLTWPGSLVYLALTEGCLVAAGVLTGRRDLLVGEAMSALASAALVLPVVLVSGTPVGGPFSAIELSRLHVAVLCAAAFVALAVSALEKRRPAGSAAARAFRAVLLAVLALGGLVLATGVVRELALGFAYVAKTDAYEGRNLEQYPLFTFAGGFSDALARQSFGFLGFLLPLVPVALVLRARTSPQRAPLLVLAAWSAGLGALALLQVRFANDVAPAASVGLALLLGGLAQRLVPARPIASGALASAVAAVLLVPVLEAQGRGAAASIAALRGAGSPGDRALETYEGTMVRFAERVRAATPETSGFDDPTRRPEYGILAYPGIGHVLHYVARRATPADNFGPYIGLENYEAVGGFFGLQGENLVLDQALKLGIRYVVTTDYGGTVAYTLVNRLHRGDGNAAGGAPPFVHFRLVTEGPSGGRAIGERFGRPVRENEAPYKLFQIVPGAILETRTAPGTKMAAEVTVVTPDGRRFPWRVETLAGADGFARLRVPYATRTDAPARPEGPWRVTIGDAVHRVDVPDEAVLTGATVSVAGPAS